MKSFPQLLMNLPFSSKTTMLSWLSLVAWILPVILLGAGVLLAAVSVARWTGSGTAASAEGSEAEGLAPADRRLLERALAVEGRGQDE